MRPVSIALLIAVVGAGCGGPDAGYVLGQCLDFRPDPSPPGRVCVVRDDGGLKISDVTLARGLPYIIDQSSGEVVAITDDERLRSINDGSDLGPAAPDTAYAHDEAGRLIGLDVDGRLETLDGELVAQFDIDGVVDVKSGIDLSDGGLAFTVERADGGFAIEVGQLATGHADVVFESHQPVGHAKWSPRGDRLAFDGPDLRSIVVVEATGRLVTEIVPTDPRLSRRVVAPSWVDDDTVVFTDGVPALVFADVPSGETVRVIAYDGDREVFPAVPVYVRKP